MACSVAENYELLSFFFDGVPKPKLEEKSVKKTGRLDFIGPPTLAEFLKENSLRSTRFFIHEPYREKKCNQCHQSRIGKGGAGLDSSMRGLPVLSAPMDKLCFKCHRLAPRRYSHAPAVSGACEVCHDAHNSANPFLLLEAQAKDLCGKCHEGETFPTEEKHREFKGQTCIQCHDPHAEDSEFFLRKDWALGIDPGLTDSIILQKSVQVRRKKG
jgi:predicted CXXCH cytochrome family protein